MSAAHTVPLEIVLTKAAPDDESEHVVCHCTNDNLAACGLDVTDTEWSDSVEEDAVCPLCRLAWPLDAPTCPWGCACDAECGPS